MVKNENILFKWSNAHDAGIQVDAKRKLWSGTFPPLTISGRTEQMCSSIEFPLTSVDTSIDNDKR